MNIFVVSNPTGWDRWEEAKAFLEPAAEQGGFTEVLEPDEELFAVMDGDELLAVATAWFAVDERFVEIKLVGGRDHRRWLTQLNEEIGARAMEAGATSLRAFGRRGWSKCLSAIGWEAFKLDDATAYVRLLETTIG